MAVTTALLTLTADEVVARLRELRVRQPVKYWAFYSSQLGGIVTDPALMVLPFDDHMVHRGHGIFDTAAIEAGKIYDLEAHLDRFIRSAHNSRLQLPTRVVGRADEPVEIRLELVHLAGLDRRRVEDPVT